MKVYLVGGAVRDALLNEPVHERDWVVVGSTPEALLKQGYQQVGRDFPVFLHPKTKEEYALARTERKAGHGYQGFQCDASPNVTLEEDLLRRDLTINAIAQDENGHFIDPYQGKQDIENKCLRHVSAAFVEDPVRVLRLARFRARFYDLGFRVADETTSLVQQMIESGELAHLVPERVWQEWEKSLKGAHPEIFIQTLQELGAYDVIFPLLKAADHHVMLKRLKRASMRSNAPVIRFAAFMSGLLDEDLIHRFCAWLRVPSAYRDLAVLTVLFEKVTDKSAKAIVSVLERVDAFRKPERFLDLLMVSEARIVETDDWQAALKACQAVDIKALVAAGFKGDAMKKALHEKRVAAVQAIL